MRTHLRKLLTIHIFLFIPFSIHAAPVLENWGSSGEYFRDTSTGLYWWDPVNFVGQSRNDIDAFVTGSSIWNWATSSQINALSGSSSIDGSDLTDIMGAAQFNTFLAGSGSGSRWIGYYADTNPDGWLIQTVLGGGLNDPTTLGASGFQNGVASWGPGAWINSTTNPVPVPGALVLLGSGLLGLPLFRKKKV